MKPGMESASERAMRLALQGLGRSGSPFQVLPPRLLLVDVGWQSLTLLEAGVPAASAAISTAFAGVGEAEGSLKTPSGWHRIHSKIGAGEPSGRVFRSREATPDEWRGEAVPDDLILGRVLPLEGLEEGFNRGSGYDSLERYIYFHGTNHSDEIGRPASHGCIRLRPRDMLDLFERVREGDAVLVAGGVPGAMPWPGPGRFHYAGVGGSGMSALAQFQVLRGGRASGSDRGFDRGERAAARAQLEALGVEIYPQDGSGVRGDCAALVLSTAVETEVPDYARAVELGVPQLHRSEVLARFVESLRSIAVTGTSGKSTVVAMIFEILRGAGRDPSVITGGELRLLQAEGLWGNAWAGKSDLLVVEADESDGSVVRYRPAVGVALNLQRDHKEMEEVAGMFRVFRGQSREGFVCGSAENLSEFASGARTFGFGNEAAVRAVDVVLGRDSSKFSVDGVAFELPVPGRHNVENALAAMAACLEVGVKLGEMGAPLASFQGVARRFQSVGVARGVEVVDDFAHNPAKIAAALETAHRRATRVLAVFQPHGYGPTRFLWKDFVETFATQLHPEDRLWFMEVFYAGGTAKRDFSSAEIIRDIAARGVQAKFAPDRAGLREALCREARAGDLILVMGARDPSLTEFCGDVLGALGGTTAGGFTGAEGSR